MAVDQRLYRLRVELYTAAQTLKGDDLAYFTELIDEVAELVDHDHKMSQRSQLVAAVGRWQMAPRGTDADARLLQELREAGMVKS